ncbi:MAG: zinc ribbon domain-containing protein [Planctomycetota bacterium]
MPLYEYCCDTCGVFEAFRPISKSESPAECPSCGIDSPRVLSVPRTRLLASSTRIGMERNEKSRHEPGRKSARPGPEMGADGTPKVKSSSSSRPWMI